MSTAQQVTTIQNSKLDPQMAADTYRSERDISDQYVQTVATWIRDSGEVLIIIRYLRAAGAKDYDFARTEDEFRGVIDTLNCMDEGLRENLGTEVAIGHCPPFNDPDNEAMISASKGGIDGPR